MLAEGAGGMRVVECACRKHYHLSVGNTRVTLSRDAFLSLVETAARAGQELGADGDLSLVTSEFYPVQ